ncbi:MAG: hypothetical protein ACE5O2_07870 [Armatimonadota bacterium]
MSLPTVQIGTRQVSRVVIGSNPFMGISYRSHAHNAWQRQHFTPQRISEVLEKCMEVGINTILGAEREERTVPQALDLLERRTGRRMQWIAQSLGGRADLQEESIARAADDGAFAVYIQGGLVDMQFHYNYVGGLALDDGDTLDRVIPWLALIRDKKMVPGLGTHRAQILNLARERGYDAEFYVTTLNYIGTYCSYADHVRAIRLTEKPVIAIKPMGGGGQVKPADAFTLCFTGMKPTDIVAVGMEHEQMVEENARLATDILSFLA